MHLLKSLRTRSFRGAVTAALAIGLGASWLVAGPAAGAPSTQKGKSLTVSTATNAMFGTILVAGNTVYTLKASKVACTAQCLHIWHELVLPKGVKKAKAGHGVNAAKLGTKKRGRGVVQVTYGGKALYWFVGDTAAGGGERERLGHVGQMVGRRHGETGQRGPAARSRFATTSSPAAPTAPPPLTHTTTPPTSASVPAPTAPAPMTPTTAAPTTTTLPPPPPPTTTTTSPGTGGVGF